MTNPYQSPEPPSDVAPDVNHSFLPLTLPHRTRLERFYPIALGTWATIEALFSLCYLSFGFVIGFVYFSALVVASIFIYRSSRIAEIVAMIQLGILWVLIAVPVAMTIQNMIFRHTPIESHKIVAVILVHVLFHLVPNTVLLVLAGMLWKEHRDT